MAMLDKAAVAFSFTSGMAALSIVSRLALDGELICGADIYGGMYRLLTKVSAEQGVRAR
jgi:cysteine-S-conjugate beta-lyase